MSDSLQPQGLQHAKLLCLSLPPGACSNSCPLSRWCHPTISSSVVPFFCLQSFPASGCFPMSQFFASGGQSIGVSASASVLPVNGCRIGLIMQSGDCRWRARPRKDRGLSQCLRESQQSAPWVASEGVLLPHLILREESEHGVIILSPALHLSFFYSVP